MRPFSERLPSWRFVLLSVNLFMVSVLYVDTSLYANTIPLQGSSHSRTQGSSARAGNAVLMDPSLSAYAQSDGAEPWTQRVSILGDMPTLQRRDISSDFGMRNTLGGSKYHEGIDIPCPTGSPILAAGSGRIIYAGFSRGYGNLVVIDHGDGITTRYAHAQQIYVRLGEYVNASQTIAAVGSTGNARTPHLHFELRQYQQPIDPTALLGIPGGDPRAEGSFKRLAQSSASRKTARTIGNQASLKSTTPKRSSVLYSHDLKNGDGGLKRKITPKPMYLSKHTGADTRTDSNHSPNQRPLTR